MKKLVPFILILALTFWFPTSFRRWTHAFRPAKCLIAWPNEKKWEVENQTKAPECLAKPFRYLTKGAQSFVFLSEDQQFVLKLFRFDCCKTPFGDMALRKLRRALKLRDKHFLSTREKIVKNFTACHLAYSLAKEETGMVYIHLNPKNSPLPPITVIDRLGTEHSIDPKKFRFVIQQKAEPFLQTFYANQNNLQPLIDSYHILLRKLASKGLVNLDRTMGRNFAFLNGQVILIDIGNLAYNPTRAEEEIAPFEIQLKEWIKRRIP